MPSCSACEHREAGNAQIHHVRVFKQYERHEVRPGVARERGSVFVNSDLVEVTAWLLWVARAPRLIAYSDIGFDNLNLVMQSGERRLDFALGSFSGFVISKCT